MRRTESKLAHQKADLNCDLFLYHTRSTSCISVCREESEEERDRWATLRRLSSRLGSAMMEEEGAGVKAGGAEGIGKGEEGIGVRAVGEGDGGLCGG